TKEKFAAVRQEGGPHLEFFSSITRSTRQQGAGPCPPSCSMPLPAANPICAATPARRSWKPSRPCGSHLGWIAATSCPTSRFGSPTTSKRASSARLFGKCGSRRLRKPHDYRRISLGVGDEFGRLISSGRLEEEPTLIQHRPSIHIHG